MGGDTVGAGGLGLITLHLTKYGDGLINSEKRGGWPVSFYE